MVIPNYYQVAMLAKICILVVLITTSVGTIKMQQYILGIDIGTGSTKGVALALDGSVLAVSQHYYSTQHPRPGFSEQQPESILQALASTVDKHRSYRISRSIAIS